MLFHKSIPQDLVKKFKAAILWTRGSSAWITRPHSFKNTLLVSALTEQGALALKSEFVSNDPKYGKKVLSSIEDGLKKCDCFYISVAFITSSGIEPLLPVLKDLENRDIKGQILTTDYLNFSEPRALEKLARFKNISLKMYVRANAKVREN